MSSKGSYKHPTFKWHLPSAVPFSTVANALVFTFRLPQWRRHRDANEVTRARLKQLFSIYSV